MIGIYCRISKKKEEGKDTSIQTQTEKGILFASKMLLPYHTYVDVGISGQKGADEREGLEKLFLDIENKKITSVWVIDQARFDRNEQLWFDFQTIIIKHKIELYIDDIRFDIENEDMRLMGNLMSAFNASYARRTGKKVKDSYFQRFNDGKWVGITPYGYTTDENGFLVIHPEQEKVVKRIFQLSLEGFGAYSIAKLLNQEEVPVKSSEFKGKQIRKKDSYTKEVKLIERDNVRWRGNVISGIIRNKIYKGVWILNKDREDETIRSAPQIIKLELYDSVINNLTINRKNVGKREQYQYLLNGLILCSNCGKEMRGKKRPKGSDSAYKCGGGSHCRGLNIAKLETFIINHLFLDKNLKDMLSNTPKTDDKILHNLDKKLEDSNQQQKKTDNKLKRILKMLNDDDLADDEEIISEYKKAKKIRNDLCEKVKAIETEIYSIKNDIPITRLKNAVDNFKLDMPFEIIKKSVHLIIKKIEIVYSTAKKEHIVIIHYLGFEEISKFKVKNPLMNWKWFSYSRAQAYNEEQMELDRKNLIGYMSETFGVVIPLSKDWQGGIHEPRFGEITLEKDKLINFN